LDSRAPCLHGTTTVGALANGWTPPVNGIGFTISSGLFSVADELVDPTIWVAYVFRDALAGEPATVLRST
jgi:hypothetical protein